MIKLTNIRTILVSVISLLLPMWIGAQVIQTNSTNNSVDYKKLARIDELVNDYINKKWLTGAVSIVIKDNQVVQYKGYGYADVDSKKPMQKGLLRLSLHLTEVG